MDKQFPLPTAVRIAEIKEENYRTKTFVFEISLDAYPGQFVMAWQPRFDEKPFSLANADPLTLTIANVGPFSGLMHEKKPGDLLWLRGPFGKGYQISPSHRRLALVAGGYGVAPLYWLAESQCLQASQVTTIIGARTTSDILYAAQFRELQFPVGGPDYASPRYNKHELLLTTEDGSAGTRGLVTSALEPLLANRVVDGIYACGPHGMLAALRSLGRQYGVPCQLSWEAYMRCGIGICGSCEYEGQVLCLDGPVLATIA